MRRARLQDTLRCHALERPIFPDGPRSSHGWTRAVHCKFRRSGMAAKQDCSPECVTPIRSCIERCRASCCSAMSLSPVSFWGFSRSDEPCAEQTKGFARCAGNHQLMISSVPPNLAGRDLKWGFTAGEARAALQRPGQRVAAHDPDCLGGIGGFRHVSPAVRCLAIIAVAVELSDRPRQSRSARTHIGS